MTAALESLKSLVFGGRIGFQTSDFNNNISLRTVQLNNLNSSGLDGVYNILEQFETAITSLRSAAGISTTTKELVRLRKLVKTRLPIGLSDIGTDGGVGFGTITTAIRFYARELQLLSIAINGQVTPAINTIVARANQTFSLSALDIADSRDAAGGAGVLIGEILSLLIAVTDGLDEMSGNVSTTPTVEFSIQLNSPGALNRVLVHNGTLDLSDPSVEYLEQTGAAGPFVETQMDVSVRNISGDGTPLTITNFTAAVTVPAGDAALDAAFATPLADGVTTTQQLNILIEALIVPTDVTLTFTLETNDPVTPVFTSVVETTIQPPGGPV